MRNLIPYQAFLSTALNRGQGLTRKNYSRGIMKTNNGLVNMVGGVALGAASLSATNADAALIRTLIETPTDYIVRTQVDNTYGATLDSGEKDEHLTIDSIAAHAGLTASQVQDQTSYSIIGSPTGDIDSGWSVLAIAPTSSEYSHVDGFPGFDFDEWTPGTVLAEDWTIPKSLFLPGYSLGEGPVDNDLFVGSTGDAIGDPTFTDSGVSYKVIPEPSSLVLLGIGGYLAAGPRRRRP